MPTSTVPPYKDENIFICDIVDLPPEDDDVKEGRAIKQHTYLDLRDEMDITVTAITDSDGEAVVEAPVADASVLPTSGVAPLLIEYDAAASTGLAITFLWELDIDGGGYNTLSTQEASSFQAVIAGTHTVRLTVTDALGDTDTDSVAVTVS